ncbi:uncharacterized protein BDR25DRAFT_313524 [Lindgomyces ingoldianus]|uniref:Uncharacterized protein n=1 Tax=Lindgomyces ingoldianus TaxID=673940 RepID=A0ACB6QXH5_9PLEO|nr:uncharacterized protein BDR25DRAFT_313524 [Lindgomyces ingoldianus]KAF2471581.1 hypothetical protein BDR25DRAFT_313524 [Lindgomyces ingoldianus]
MFEFEEIVISYDEKFNFEEENFYQKIFVPCNNGYRLVKVKLNEEAVLVIHYHKHLTRTAGNKIKILVGGQEEGGPTIGTRVVNAACCGESREAFAAMLGGRTSITENGEEKSGLENVSKLMKDSKPSEILGQEERAKPLVMRTNVLWR